MFKSRLKLAVTIKKKKKKKRNGTRQRQCKEKKSEQEINVKQDTNQTEQSAACFMAWFGADCALHGSAD